MKMNQIEELTGWLLGQGRDNPYCDVGVVITYHAGAIKKIEKRICVKIKNDTQTQMVASKDEKKSVKNGGVQ